MEQGADVNHANDRGVTPLINACRIGWAEVGMALIEAGADLNRADDDGSTALHCASAVGYTDLIKALLREGAAVNQADTFGDTPVHFAARLATPEAATDLLRWGADPSLVTNRGQTAADYSDDSPTKPVIEAWARGEHPLQAERAALEAAMLAASREMPVDVARFCGDYVHLRP